MHACAVWCVFVMRWAAAFSSDTEPTPFYNKCHNANDSGTYERYLAEKVLQECASKVCDRKYWKLKITVKKVTTENSTCKEAAVCFHLSSAKLEDVAASEIKKEFSSLKTSIRLTYRHDSPRFQICSSATTNFSCGLIFADQHLNHPHNVSITTKPKNLSSSPNAISALVVTPKHDMEFNDGYYYACRSTPFVIVNTVGLQNASVVIRVDQTRPLHCMEYTVRIRRVTRVCAFFNASSHRWNPSVCSTRKLSATLTECSCNHNSTFAVIFALTTVQLDTTLLTISTACETISSIALIVCTILLAVYRRKTKNFDRVLVQICLCTSLAMTHIWLLLSQAAISNNAFCQVGIVSSHFFLTTSTVFMVMEGSIMLKDVLAPNLEGSPDAKRRRIGAFIVGWICPIVYVAMCAVFGIRGGKYGNFIDEVNRFEVCWITDSFNLVVIVPVSMALIINIIIIIRLAMLVGSMSRQAEEFKPANQRDCSRLKHAKSAIRAASFLLPVLGIPWVIGFLINVGPPADVAFASIHIIVNGCQGLYVFLMYVVFNADMRKNIKRSWRSVKSENTSFRAVAFFTSTNRSS